MIRRVVVAAGVAGLGLLAACSEDGAGAGASPALPDQTPALWNTCDALDATFIEREFGSVTTEESGTPTQPECRFAPDGRSGQVAVTSSYTLFDGTLDDAWKTMNQPADADVSEPRIRGADAARVVVDVVRQQLYVTGFVQNGDLIQNVNVVDPAPFDRERVIAGVERTLAVLSEHAVNSGLTAPDP